MRVLGDVSNLVRSQINEIVQTTTNMPVTRATPPRSKTPFPASTDLEGALLKTLSAAGFSHHHSLFHPLTGERFEYDFWRPTDGIALEVMGYRADDEIYKDLLKFHVHSGTRVGVVMVPRW